MTKKEHTPGLPEGKEIEALLEAIRKNPEDDTPRGVLADLIDEIAPDQHALAELYRGGAKRWLEEFAEKHGGEREYEDEEEDEDGNLTTVTSTHDEYAWCDYDYLVSEGSRCVKGERDQWTGPHFNCGNIQGLADDLNDTVIATMFWTCIEVVTGIRGAARARGKVWGSCAC